jgi:cold shock CspA family protein
MNSRRLMSLPARTGSILTGIVLSVKAQLRQPGTCRFDDHHPKMKRSVGIQDADRQGKVVRYEKGLWLHHPDDGGRDLFVHITAVHKAGYTELVQGVRVSY